MSYWILPISCRPISCTTVQRLTNVEKKTDDWKRQMDDFEEKVQERLKISDDGTNHLPDEIRNWNSFSIIDEDPEFIEEWNRIINNSTLLHGNDDMIEKINDDKSENDNIGLNSMRDPYLHMEVGLPRGDDDRLVHAKVKSRAVDVDGNPMGIGNNNPLLDTRVYEVEFVDGTTEKLTANIIAENLLAQVDEEGHRQLLLDEIIDHSVNDEAITMENAYYTVGNTKRLKRTTKGWDIYVQWKDGSTDWIALKDLKDSYPVELTDYAINNGIHQQPAFAW